MSDYKEIGLPPDPPARTAPRPAAPAAKGPKGKKKKPGAEHVTHGGSVGIVLQIPTPISEGGTGLQASYTLGFQKGFKRFTLSPNFQYMFNKMNYLPSASTANRLKTTHWSARLTLGEEERSPIRAKKGKPPWGIYRFITSTHFGVGGSDVPPYERVGISYDRTKATTFDIGTTTSGGLDIILGRTMFLGITGGLTIGNSFAGRDSDFNRIVLQAGINISLSDIGAASAATGSKKNLFSDVGLAYTLLSMGLGAINRYITNEVVNNPAEEAQALIGGEPQADSTVDLPTLKGIVAFLGAVSRGSEMKLHSNTERYNWTIPVTRAIIGAGYLASKHTGGKSGALGDILSAGGMGINWAFGIDTPSKRAKLGDKKLRKRALYAFLTRAALNTLGFGIGAWMLAAGAKDPDSSGQKWGSALLGGAMSTHGGLVFSADSSRFKRRFRAAYIPASYYTGPGMKNKGGRGGIVFSTTMDMFRSDLTLSSPMLTLVNTGKRLDTTAPYTDATLPTGIGFAFGLHKNFKLGSRVGIALFGGLSQVNQLGGKGNYAGGIGGKASVDLTIRAGQRWGFLLGLMARGHYMFANAGGKPGEQFEFAPYLGFYLN